MFIGARQQVDSLAWLRLDHVKVGTGKQKLQENYTLIARETRRGLPTAEEPALSFPLRVYDQGLADLRRQAYLALTRGVKACLVLMADASRCKIDLRILYPDSPVLGALVGCALNSETVGGGRQCEA